MSNKRVYRPRTISINGVDAGGMMSARITEGFDNILTTPPDGLNFPLVDRLTQFCRGTLVTQDWVEFVNILTGASTSLVFYEKQSGADTFIKHTINNPIVHRARLSFNHRSYARVEFDFECKAASAADTLADMHEMTDAQTSPLYSPAVRGVEITAASHGTQDILHVARFDFDIAFTLFKASHDGDLAYTAVDAAYGDSAPSGTLVFQDASITSAKLLAQTLVLASAAALELTIKQSQGAAAKTVTIANVLFGSADEGPSAESKDYSEFSLPFMVANSDTVPLSFDGDNKLISIT